MGSGDESTPAKPSKPTASTQETPITPSYPDWQTSMQAYYGTGATTPPPFFPPTVASSPASHPYMWGSQHLMPPYGTPLPYPVLYPHGGLYAHPGMAVAQNLAPATIQMEGKAPDGKDQASMKNSKGSSGNMGLVGCKSGGNGKSASGSGNDGGSQSAESGTEGSSDGSDEDTNQKELSATKKRSFDQMLAEGANAQNNSGATVESSFSSKGQPLASNIPVPVPGKPVVTIPGTNLNIGMEHWSASSGGTVQMKARLNSSGVSQAMAPAMMVGHEGAMPENQWVQDERELKRQKRKQSNRESARRSRLRKQAECEELQVKVEALGNENHMLRSELQRLAEECEKLTSENNSIMEELNRLYGPDAISSLGVNNGNTSVIQSTITETNSHEQETSKGNNSVSGQNGNLCNSNGKLDSGSN